MEHIQYDQYNGRYVNVNTGRYISMAEAEYILTNGNMENPMIYPGQIFDQARLAQAQLAGPYIPPPISPVKKKDNKSKLLLIHNQKLKGLKHG